MSKRDYYEILGIKKDASADEIKKAFRKAAVKHHPDKEGGDEAKFKEVNEAYEVLKDQQKRQRYDQFGHAGVGGSSGGGNPFEGFGGAGAQGFDFNFGGGTGGLEDLFGSFFGGQAGAQGPRRGRDVETEVVLEFEDAVFGTEKTITLTIDTECEHCKGTMAEPGHGLKTCETCKGSGQQVRVMNTMFGAVQQAVTCQPCKGKGQMPEKACSVCQGKGVKRKSNDVTIKVPAGIDDGATIRLSGRGEAIGDGERGDLYVHIRVRAHKKFTREGDLILSTEHISMVDAALGTEIDVETVDGVITMKVPAGTQSGTDFKLSGHGVTRLRNGGRGAHIVTIAVDIPTKLSRKQKEILEQFRSAKKHSLF